MLIDSDYSTEFKSKKETIDKMESILNGGALSQIKAQLAQEKKKSMITAGIFCAVIGVVGLIAVSIAVHWALGLTIFFSMGILFLIAWFTINNGVKKKYANMLAPIVVETLYGPGAIYNAKGGYSREYLEGLGSFPVNSLDQEDFIQGKYLGIPFNMCDVKSYHYETRGSGDNRHQEIVIDFLGSIMSFGMNKASKSLLRVTENKFAFGGNKKTIDFESFEFNKKFNAFCDDPENAFYIITPQLQFALLDMESHLPGSMSLLFRGKELVVIISGNTTDFESVDFKKSENYNLNAIIDSILAPAFVIDKMNLDHKFFITEEDVKQMQAEQDAKAGVQNKAAEESEEKKDLDEVDKQLKEVKDSGILGKEEVEKIKEVIKENE